MTTNDDCIDGVQHPTDAVNYLVLYYTHPHVRIFPRIHFPTSFPHLSTFPLKTQSRSRSASLCSPLSVCQYHCQPAANVAVRARDDNVGSVFTVDDRLKRATKPSKHSKEMAITVYLIHHP